MQLDDEHFKIVSDLIATNNTASFKRANLVNLYTYHKISEPVLEYIFPEQYLFDQKIFKIIYTSNTYTEEELLKYIDYIHIRTKDNQIWRTYINIVKFYPNISQKILDKIGKIIEDKKGKNSIDYKDFISTVATYQHPKISQLKKWIRNKNIDMIGYIRKSKNIPDDILKYCLKTYAKNMKILDLHSYINIQNSQYDYSYLFLIETIIKTVWLSDDMMEFIYKFSPIHTNTAFKITVLTYYFLYQSRKNFGPKITNIILHETVEVKHPNPKIMMEILNSGYIFPKTYIDILYHNILEIKEDENKIRSTTLEYFTKYQPLTEEFITANLDELCCLTAPIFQLISRNRNIIKLSPEFLEKYKHQLDWNGIFATKDISEKIVENYLDYAGDNKFNYLRSNPYLKKPYESDSLNLLLSLNNKD